MALEALLPIEIGSLPHSGPSPCMSNSPDKQALAMASEELSIETAQPESQGNLVLRPRTSRIPNSLDRRSVSRVFLHRHNTS